MYVSEDTALHQWLRLIGISYHRWNPPLKHWILLQRDIVKVGYFIEKVGGLFMLFLFHVYIYIYSYDERVCVCV